MPFSLSDAVASTAEPAFVSRPSAGVVAWNRAAERLLGYQEAEILGKPCHSILCGRDIYGNPYCNGNCPIFALALGREAVSRFEVICRSAAGEDVPAEVSIVVLPTDHDDEPALLHLLRSLDRNPVPTEFAWDLTRTAASQAVRPTPRQLEVLRLLAEGHGTHKIADLLCISDVTVRNHIENLLQRLEVHSRLEAVSVARRAGLI